MLYGKHDKHSTNIPRFANIYNQKPVVGQGRVFVRLNIFDNLSHDTSANYILTVYLSGSVIKFVLTWQLLQQIIVASVMTDTATSTAMGKTMPIGIRTSSGKTILFIVAKNNAKCSGHYVCPRTTFVRTHFVCTKTFILKHQQKNHHKNPGSYNTKATASAKI